MKKNIHSQSCKFTWRRIVSFLMTGNSIQTWMWVEKGVPGVSTCTVWQSEYPSFLICPFSHVVSLTTPTLCEVWEVSCNSFHKPYTPVSALRKAPHKTHTCMALSGTGSCTTHPQRCYWKLLAWGCRPHTPLPRAPSSSPAPPPNPDTSFTSECMRMLTYEHGGKKKERNRNM